MLERFLKENGKFDVPSNVESIRFDIGLSYCVPNSAYWLNKNKNTFVFGIEANKYAVDSIIKKGLYTNQYGISIPFPNDNFLLENNFEKVINNSYVNGEVVDSTYFNKSYESLRNKIDSFVL